MLYPAELRARSAEAVSNGAKALHVASPDRQCNHSRLETGAAIAQGRAGRLSRQGKTKGRARAGLGGAELDLPTVRPHQFSGNCKTEP